MNPIIEEQLKVLQKNYPDASAKPLPSGAHLITVPDVKLPDGWNRQTVAILFLAPPGYPAGQPDCFWADPIEEPGALRFGAEKNQTPQASNDSNPIPEVGPRGTWFSWHLQSWDPNRDSLLTYLNVIKQRLNPPR